MSIVFYGGERWIRTTEPIKERIYSPLRLTTSLSPLNIKQSYINYIFIIAYFVQSVNNFWRISEESNPDLLIWSQKCFHYTKNPINMPKNKKKIKIIISVPTRGIAPL